MNHEHTPAAPVGQSLDLGSVPTWTGPTVLIAIDGTEMSTEVVRAAHRLFGETATYLAINVGPVPYGPLMWPAAWPLAGPSRGLQPAWVDDAIDNAVAANTAFAEAAAASATRRAGLDQAMPLGDLGDPASAILRAAEQHRVDVVVVGADSRNWLSRLVEGSVERGVLQGADVAVLVVASQVLAPWPSAAVDDVAG
jgi:nucleotide-binding universal stress UspA family protein